MTNYIQVTWPDIQKFMDNDNWNKCYYGFSEEINFNDNPTCYFVPEDLYDEVMEERMFPAEQDINLGHLFETWVANITQA